MNEKREAKQEKFLVERENTHYPRRDRGISKLLETGRTDLCHITPEK